ncbi:MAG: FtsX-like permease family protein, partial [Schleiferiaceae bacterium]|nr:FtsX-like permease family protein [Schleiferiaceae bacterium]
SMVADKDWLNQVNAHPNVESASPRLSGFGLFTLAQHSEVGQWVGVDFTAEGKDSWIQRLDAGSYDIPDGQEVMPVWLGRRMAENLNSRLGDTLIALGQGFRGSPASGRLILAGTLKLGNPQLESRVAILHLADAQFFSGAEGMWGQVLITPKQPEKSLALTPQLANDLPLANALWSSWEERMPELQQAIEADSAGGIVMLFILYMVIGFGLLGTMIMLASERQREFTMQIALGVRRKLLAQMMLLEAFFMSLLGVIAGAVMGRAVTFYFHINPPQMVGEAAEAMESQGWDPVLPPSMDLSIISTHALVVVILTMLVSLWAVSVVYRSPAIQR